MNKCKCLCFQTNGQQRFKLKKMRSIGHLREVSLGLFGDFKEYDEYLRNLAKVKILLQEPFENSFNDITT